jgi:hypothetical protein
MGILFAKSFLCCKLCLLKLSNLSVFQRTILPDPQHEVLLYQKLTLLSWAGGSAFLDPDRDPQTIKIIAKKILRGIFTQDLEGLERQSLEGARFGFTGKQVIHPGQVPVVQRAFLPAPERVEWARQLIAAFRAYEAEGRGAFSFKGHMIDMPTVKQARNVLALVPGNQKGDDDEI